uniref:histidine kinase n=2 Tax=Amphora coffeiformis TaxID=265554 RepID=A0A7S3LB42_9STRA
MSSSPSKSGGGRKYGDLISAGGYSLCLVAILVREMDPTGRTTPRRLAVPITLSHVVTIACGISSFIASDSTLLSVLTILGDILTIGLLNASNFLQYEDSSLLLELIWVFLMIGADFDLSFYVKACLGACTLVGGIVSTLYSELPVPLVETTQLLLLCAILHTVIHYIMAYPPALVDTDWITVHGARAVLAATFCHHMWTELCVILLHPNTQANAGTYAAVKACVLAVAGLASVGTFSTNINEKNCLQALVEERSREIRRQEDKLLMVGLALQASETAIAITDSQKRIIWCNPAFERMAASARESCKCNNNQQQYPQKQHALFDRSIADVLQLTVLDGSKLLRAFHSPGRHEDDISVGGSLYNVDVSPYLRDGREDGQQQTANSCDEQYHEAGNSNGIDHRYVVAFKDITEFRKLQSAEKAVEREAMMSKAMSDSMEVLTHELRTPLQGIMGITSMLIGDKTLPKAALDMLELIMASSSLLLVLINNLLDIRKCNADMMDEFQLTPSPSAQPMKDACDFCRPLAAISQVDLVLDLGDTEHAIVQSDSLRMQQILINLLSNAIKYTPEGGTVRLKSRTSTLPRVEEMMKNALATGAFVKDNMKYDHQNVLIIQVIDSGAGIPAGQEKLLFHKFAQLKNKADSNKRNGKTAGQPHGTGLGLNLVKQFTELMDGHLWVTNNASSKGATFSVCLPLVSNDEVSLLRHTTSPSESSPIKDRIGVPVVIPKDTAQYRVLLVDDTLINRKVFERMLKLVPSVEMIKSVESGKKALDELRLGNYNFVITDVQMPGMDGFELCRAIQQSETLMETPLVVVGLTADTSQRVQDCCLQSGMADVIYKPITAAEMNDYFQTTVRKLIRAEQSKTKAR